MPTTYVVQAATTKVVVHATTKMFEAIDIAMRKDDPQQRKDIARMIRKDKKEFSAFAVDVNWEYVIHVFNKDA